MIDPMRRAVDLLLAAVGVAALVAGVVLVLVMREWMVDGVWSWGALREWALGWFTAGERQGP